MTTTAIAPARFFTRLGSEVLRRWRAHNNEERAFPEIATGALEAASPSEHVRFADAVGWSLTATLPWQSDLAAEFGEPPLTVFMNDLFRIELLFWVDGTTSIHQHSFSGAFHVLAGSSLHSRYRFTPRRRINSRLAFGDLALVEAELLGLGDTRPIVAGASGTHSLFHLDRPSVTVVVRTHHDPESSPQLNLRRPGIAIDPFHRTPELTRRLQVLRMLQRVEHAERRGLTAKAFEAADVETVVRALDEMLAELGPGPEFEALLELARPRLRDLHSTMVACYEEMKRQASITSRRSSIRDPELRFFLALLLNLPSRAAILDFVAGRYGVEPVGKVMRFVKALARTKPGVQGGPNAIGVSLDETTLAVLRGLVEGRTGRALEAKLSETYTNVAAERVRLRKLCDALRASWLFRTLLT